MDLTIDDTDLHGVCQQRSNTIDLDDVFPRHPTLQSSRPRDSYDEGDWIWAQPPRPSGARTIVDHTRHEAMTVLQNANGPLRAESLNSGHQHLFWDRCVMTPYIEGPLYDRSLWYFVDPSRSLSNGLDAALKILQWDLQTVVGRCLTGHRSASTLSSELDLLLDVATWRSTPTTFRDDMTLHPHEGPPECHDHYTFDAPTRLIDSTDAHDPHERVRLDLRYCEDGSLVAVLVR